MVFSRPWRFCAIAVFSFTAATLWAAYPEGYDQRYVDAVNLCKQLELAPSRIDYHLTTIGASDHIRDSQNRILMTCFTDYSGYNRSYQGTTGYRPAIWSAVAPEMQDFLLNNNVTAANASDRSKQLLGMPLNAAPYFVTEFYINTSSLFRPATDPDITNPVSSTTLAECMKPGNYYYEWYMNNMSTYYKSVPYPWTRLGYTYDWGISTWPNIGLTEFIAKESISGSDPIYVQAVITIQSYLYYNRDMASFDVTGDCDSIWLGSNNLPVVTGGNTVFIHSGCVISGGEGITVTDRSDVTDPSSFVIVNDGIIKGQSKTHSGTARDSSVYFTNASGMFVNHGTVTGDRVGVLSDETNTRPIVIINTGTITGTSYSIRTGAGDDYIGNSGTLTGNVSAGAGNDTIDVFGGAIDGNIDGGADANSLHFALSDAGATFVLNHDILNMTTTSISSGTVRLNGQVAGDVTVYDKGALGGNCSIDGNLNNSNIVSPGNSIGTISVGGNYTQSTGSQLAIEIAKQSGGVLLADMLSVTGAATLAAGSVIDISNAAGSTAVFQTGDTFHFLSATGGLNDLGASLTSESAFLSFTPIVGANDYSFTLNRAATFSSVAASGNNTAIASAMDADCAAASGVYAGLLNQLMFMNATAFNSSLSRLSPAAYFTVSATSNRTAQYWAEGVGDYLRGRRRGQINQISMAAFEQNRVQMTDAIGHCDETDMIRECQNSLFRRDSNPSSEWSVFADSFGLFYGEKSEGDHLGFQSDIVGVQFGMDKQVAAGTIFGIGGGYDHTYVDTNNSHGTGKIDTFRVGPYGTRYDDYGFLDLSFTGGFHDNSLDRIVDSSDGTTAHGSYNADDLSLYLGGGRNWQIGQNIVSPMVSMQYIYYYQYGCTETGAEGANLKVYGQDINSLRSRVGMQLSRRFTWGQATIVPELYGGWAHEYMENEPLEARFLGGVTPFSIDRGGVFRDAGIVTTGVTMARNKQTSIFTRYQGEFGSGGQFNAVDVGLTHMF